MRHDRLYLWLIVASVLAAPAALKADILVTEGGTEFEGKVDEGKDEFTLTLPNGGRMKFPRSMVKSVVRGDAAAARPGVKEPAAAEKPKPAAPNPAKPGAWSDAEEQKVEDALNRFFAAKDDAARKAVYAEIAKTRLDRPLADLDHMREVAQKKGLLKHVEVPWLKGAPRGWYDIAIPDAYTPEKAWPLVLALHGMPSDGDNLVSFYAPYFSPRGYIVLFPTTLHPSSFWPSPDEKQELLRLLHHVSTLYRLDYRRIYCTGASGGGIGTWHWLTTLPELFAGGISFSAAGTIFDKRLEKLKGVPFYVHHGGADGIPVASVQASVDAARRLGVSTIELYVSEGTGHTPPPQDWNRAFDWLVKVPPNKVSPRYLLECPEGTLPIGYGRDLPFIGTPEPEALAKVRAEYKTKAAAWKFPDRLLGDRFLTDLHAIARIVDPASPLEPVRDGVKRIAERVRKELKAGATPLDTLYALNEVFFQAEGFCRDGADPTGEAPESFGVDHVLKVHTGNVFSLTGLYVAVAEELGLPVVPVVAPYHAFARFDDGKEVLNVEMTEVGGHFGDAVYATGYGLRNLASGKAAKAKGESALLAAAVAKLGSMARQGGQPEMGSAAAKLALSLDPACFRALMLQAQAARDAKQPAEALKALDRAAAAWPDYAEPRLLEGELLAQSGAAMAAVDAYTKGVRARLKPFNAVAQYDAELYYHIAQVYAGLVREALRTQNSAAGGYMNKFNDAIVATLRNNPRHAGAIQLFQEMGGRIH